MVSLQGYCITFSCREQSALVDADKPNIRITFIDILEEEVVPQPRRTVDNRAQY
jgi:hypothetical protein